MAVYQVQNNRSGGPFSSGLGIVGTLLSFVPGMQPVGAAMKVAGSLAGGKPMEAAQNLGGMIGGSVKPNYSNIQAYQSSSPQNLWTNYRRGI